MQEISQQPEETKGTFADNVAAVQIGDAEQMGVPLNQMTSARETI